MKKETKVDSNFPDDKFLLPLEFPPLQVWPPQSLAVDIVNFWFLADVLVPKCPQVINCFFVDVTHVIAIVWDNGQNRRAMVLKMDCKSGRLPDPATITPWVVTHWAFVRGVGYGVGAFAAAAYPDIVGGHIRCWRIGGGCENDCERRVQL
ncbi:MAG: hypothetical protein LQ352_006898 [Teloschistes flavicans]|nr:MAG: hypothetical protein LQ352_006898 [Teloschistes flavicans]